MTFSFPKLRFLRFSRAKDGVAAAEFALAAPVLIFSLVIMSDLGMAASEHMKLDQAVRSAAEFVMDDIRDEAQIKRLIIASATGIYSSTPSAAELSARPTATAIKACECPEAPGATVACSGTICANLLPPFVFYDLTVARTYDANFLPDIPLRAELRVQTR